MYTIAIQSCQIVKNNPCPPRMRCSVTGTRSFPHKCPGSQQPLEIPFASLWTFFERGKFLDKKMIYFVLGIYKRKINQFLPTSSSSSAGIFFMLRKIASFLINFMLSWLVLFSFGSVKNKYL